MKYVLWLVAENQPGTYFICIFCLPSSCLLRIRVVPHSVLLRFRLVPMERRWSVGNSNKVSNKTGVSLALAYPVDGEAESLAGREAKSGEMRTKTTVRHF